MQECADLGIKRVWSTGAHRGERVALSR